MGRGTLVGFLIFLLGLGILLICLIPVTSVDEVINTSFTVSAGTKYGPNDAGTSYHTRILGKSVLKGEIVVEGEGIYLTVNFYNAEHLKDVYVGGQYSFRVDPADDLYVFIFDNTEGSSKSLVRFRLEEIWTRPMAIGSPPLFILGLIGFSSFLAGPVTLAIAHTTRYLSHHIRLRKARCYLGDRKILADDVPVKRALALNIFVAIIKLNVPIRQIFE